MKGKVDQELQDVLNQLKSEDAKTWNPRQVEHRIARNYERYGLEAPLSYTAISNAFSGKNITNRVSNALRSLVGQHDKSLLQATLESVDLNLQRFWDIDEGEFARSAREADGCYQVYARSNVFPDYLWLGRLTFSFVDDIRSPRLLAKSEAHRPQIGSLSEKIIVSDGYAAPNGSQSFFVVFRSRFERGDESGALCIFERVNRNHTGKIDKMMGHCLQFEAETKEYALSHWLVKRAECDKVRQEYVKISEFDEKPVLDELNLTTKPRAS